MAPILSQINLKIKMAIMEYKIMLTPKVWIGSNNYFTNRNGEKPKWIIIHGTAGSTTIEGLGNHFRTTEGTENPVSSHYGIGKDGRVGQYVAERAGAWSNGYIGPDADNWWASLGVNPNNVTISIECCKASRDNSDALTPAQQEVAFALIKEICDRQNILPVSAGPSGGITGHFSFDRTNRANCPGLFPWQELWDYLRPVPNYRAIAAYDTWKSTASLFGGVLDYETGIAQSWQSRYVNQQRIMPPPTTREFDSVNWNGDHIVVQIFGHLRCEWVNGNHATWYELGTGKEV